METPETRAKLASAIRDLETKGDTNTITSLVSAYKAKYQAVPQEQSQPAKAPGIFSVGTLKGQTSYPANEGGVESIPGNIARTAGNIPSSAAKIARGVVAPFNPLDTENPLNIGANVVKGVQTAQDIFKDRGLVGGLKDIASGVGDTALKIFKAPGEFILEQGRKQQEDPEKYTRDFQTKVAKIGIEDPLLIPSLIYGGPKAGLTKEGAATDAISTIAQPFTRGADTSLENIASNTKQFVKDLTTKSEEQIDSAILKKYQKGVKPLLPGKTTPSRLDAYNEDAVNAVKTINENKGSLKLSDGEGDFVTGKNPETLQQMSEAIEQTKKNIFSKYDTLAKQAGSQGLKIDTAPIASELDVISGNEALKLSHPETVKYAQEVKDRYSNFDSKGNFLGFKQIDATVTQDVIQNYNKSLEAFYRNPSYDTASRAAVDSMIANRLRQALDDGVTGLTGKEYQALKNQYGSLKAIEKDVIKASLRDARKNVKGLLDFTDVFSGGQVVNGIVSLNPGMIASGLGQKAISAYYKYLNNPNRAIKNMFRVAGDITPTKTLRVRSLPSDYTNVLPEIPMGETPVPKGKRTLSLPSAEGAPQVFTPPQRVTKTTTSNASIADEPYIPPEKLPVIQMGKKPVPKGKRNNPLLPNIK